MAGPYAPSDDIIGPIIHEIALIIQTGIPSIEYVHERVPDRAPANNHVLLPILKIHQLDDTNGKLKIRITIGARHVFRRTELDAGITKMYTYIMPWLFLIAAWPNQTLNGRAIQMEISDVIPTRIMESGQAYIALAINFDVLTEFNIPLV